MIFLKPTTMIFFKTHYYNFLTIFFSHFEKQTLFSEAKPLPPNLVLHPHACSPIMDAPNKRKVTSVDGAPATKRVRLAPTLVSAFYTPHQVNAIAISLRKYGFAVITPIGGAALDRVAVRASLDAEVVGFSEFKEDAVDRAPLGGFAAYGNPSSFHNPTVRDLRLKAYDIVAPTLDAMIERKYNGFKKEVLIDRVVIRSKNRTPGAESWHRDEAPTAATGDVVLGGWWNLDDSVSHFSCIPKSHRGVKGHAGFARITSKEEIAAFTDKKTLVSIPPGAILLFNEKIVHEVLNTRRAFTTYRLFLGWRITKATTPLIGDILFTQLEDQAPVTIKSGQAPPMWAKLHWTNWLTKLSAYSANFKAECLEAKTVASGANKGNEFNIVHRHMRSLKEYGLPLYPAYTDKEKAVLTPH
jgi:hypothetical protein